MHLLLPQPHATHLSSVPNQLAFFVCLSFEFRVGGFCLSNFSYALDMRQAAGKGGRERRRSRRPRGTVHRRSVIRRIWIAPVADVSSRVSCKRMQWKCYRRRSNLTLLAEIAHCKASSLLASSSFTLSVYVYPPVTMGRYFLLSRRISFNSVGGAAVAARGLRAGVVSG